MISQLFAAFTVLSGATCTEPPSFEFKEVPKAVRYRYLIKDSACSDYSGGRSYTEPTPTNSLAHIWDKLANGPVTLRVEGLDHGNNIKGIAGEATFTKAPATRVEVPGVAPEFPNEKSWPVRDKVLGENLWLWGHHGDSLVAPGGTYGLKREKHADMGEAARLLGTPNVCIIRWKGMPANPFDGYFNQFSNATALAWSVKDPGDRPDALAAKRKMALEVVKREKKVTKLYYDDLFDWERDPKAFADEVTKLRDDATAAAGRKIEIAGVVYTGQFDSLETRKAVQALDEVSLWVWNPEDVGKSVVDARRARAFLGKSKRLLLGVYLYDYEHQKPMPEKTIKMQLRMAKDLFVEGTIDGLVFCASYLCDTDQPAVKYAKFWIGASKSAKQNPPAVPEKKTRNPHLQPNPELPDGYVEAHWVPIAAGEANLAPLGEEYDENNFEVHRRGLIDGSHGTRAKEGATIRFSHPVTLTEVRLSLPPETFTIEADRGGDGKYETLLASVTNGNLFSTWGDLPELVWYVKRFPKPVTVRSVRLSCGSTELQLIGPEFEAAKFAAPAPLASAPKLTQEGAARTNWTDVAEDERLYFGFTMEGWMLGAQGPFGNYYKKGTPVPPVTQWASWSAFTNDWNYFNANFILFFPPKTSVQPPGSKRRGPFPEALLWPSKVWYLTQPFNIMQQFNDEIHKFGWKNFVITRSWLFHEDKAKLDALGAKPQVVLADEIAATGADGVAAGYDEQTFGLPGAGVMAPELLKEMMKTSDLDRMPQKSDSPDSKYRNRFNEWYYSQIQGGWMREVKQAQMKRNPKALTFCGYGGCDCTWHYVNSIGGSDYWGYDGDVDVIGGDGTYCDMSDQPYGSAGTFVNSAVQVAYSKKRLSMATLGYNWANVWSHQENRERNAAHYIDHPDVCLVAGTLATYFAKGTFANYWRWNYANNADLKSPTVRPALRDAGFMTRTLAAWGGRKAEVPKDVLILRSRRSEHFWYARALMGNDVAPLPDGRDRYASWHTMKRRDTRMRAGDTYFFWTAHQLVKAAMPFEIYPIQRVAAWKDKAKDYKAIVIPSGYVIADDELAELKKFAALGRKIIVVGAAAGEADGFGEKRAVNAFADVPNVIILPFTPAFDTNGPELEKKFADALRAAVPTPALTLARDKDRDVQAYRLNAKDGSALVMVANYSERTTAVNLGVQLPKGKYELEVCSSGVTKPGFHREGAAGVRAGLVGGKKIFTAEEAKAIRLDLVPEDCYLLRFRPVSFWKGLFK